VNLDLKKDGARRGAAIVISTKQRIALRMEKSSATDLRST
jgi:hypothetical protein